MLCENINRIYKYQYSLHLSIRLGHLEIHILALSNLNFDDRTFELDSKQGGKAGRLFSINISNQHSQYNFPVRTGALKVC